MAAPLVSDALWSLFSPLLPPRPPRPKGGRPPVGDRAALTGILWGDADHLATRQLWEYLASYPYLARLRDKGFLEGAVNLGLGQLVCDHFAFAERFDEASGR